MTRQLQSCFGWSKTYFQTQQIDQQQYDAISKRLNSVAFNFTHDPTLSQSTPELKGASGGSQLMITDGSKDAEAPTEAPPTLLSCRFVL